MFTTMAKLIQLPYLRVKYLLQSVVCGTAAAASGTLLEMQILRPVTQNGVFNQIPRCLLCT